MGNIASVLHLQRSGERRKDGVRDNGIERGSVICEGPQNTLETDGIVKWIISLSFLWSGFWRVDGKDVGDGKKIRLEENATRSRSFETQLRTSANQIPAFYIKSFSTIYLRVFRKRKPKSLGILGQLN